MLTTVQDLFLTERVQVGVKEQTKAHVVMGKKPASLSLPAESMPPLQRHQ